MEIEGLAERRLGFTSLRPGQKEAVEALLAGEDVLAVMPTGSGKSAIYQLAGLVLGGPTVVVSPLLALQRDQVESIEETGAAEAAALNSSLGARAREQALAEVERGDLEFLLLAPEQFENEEVLERLAASKPSLFVVDEAHSVSEWGHDFRPEYLRLGAVVERLGRPRVLALTATASPPVRAEILERLGIEDAHVVVRGFDRPNIWLGVETFSAEGPKLEALVERVAAEPKPGIVYTATRRQAEELADELSERGVRAVAYHGGMNRGDRTAAQEAFMGDEVEVVAATTAFGMGVDKPNVRFVFHAEPADSVDSYYQEVGRGGRDRAPARAVLFYRPEDLGMRRFFAGSPKDDQQREFERSRVEMMGAYAESSGCRREFVLTYFGELFSPPCGNCDNCQAGLVDAVDDSSRPFAEGSRVTHERWGEGTVQRYEEGSLVVLFESVGYKKLGLDMVLERGLLASVDGEPR